MTWPEVSAPPWVSPAGETLTHIARAPLKAQFAGGPRDGIHAAPSRRVPTWGAGGEPLELSCAVICSGKALGDSASGCQTRARTLPLSSARLTHAVQAEPGLAKVTVVLKYFIENH